MSIEENHEHHISGPAYFIETEQYAPEAFGVSSLVADPLPSEREAVVRQAHELAGGLAVEQAAREAEMMTGGMSRIMSWARRFRPGQWATAGAALFTPVAATALFEAVPAVAASSSKQACIEHLERPPYGISSVMHKPSGRLEVITTASYSDVPDCDSWKRLGKYRVQIKDDGHWKNVEGSAWYPTGVGISDTNAAYDMNQAAFATHGVFEKRVHGHWEPARVQFRNSVSNKKTGKVIATGKIKTHSVKIEG